MPAKLKPSSPLRCLSHYNQFKAAHLSANQRTNTMASRTLDELAPDLKQRRLAGDWPLTLLLGAGASVGAGIGAMPQLYKLAGVADFKEFSQYISSRTEAERFRFLMSFLQILRPDPRT